ncbi:MAG: class I SAM-dependent methyltransferase [Planctomycetota bacterium]|nr:class I SAM-dependent methyltransferase [Pirellulaceae bacterium]MEC8161585.1 class I SAM-dependent methyltransferase [Planctomycetota bacterium]MED5286533.1 class I SAM-dependent methyltransferase [Planctomycetota bacterium]
MDSQPSWTHVHEQNRKAWDRLVDRRNRFARPASDQDCHDPLAAVDGLGWLGGNIEGKELLCLAAGGGRQSAIYASAGARVTVVDISPGMLELDREVARERRLDIHVVEASMDDLRGLTPQSFDIAIHPVSTCYVPDVVKVFQQVARVLKGGGIYISQHKSPVSLQATIKPGDGGYVIQSPYYSKQAVPKVSGTSLREEGCLEFVHRWEEIIGGMCRCGFVIEDLVEPMHAKPESPRGEFGHRAQFIAPYLRIKARRREQAVTPSSDSNHGELWLPQ